MGLTLQVREGGRDHELEIHWSVEFENLSPVLYWQITYIIKSEHITRELLRYYKFKNRNLFSALISTKLLFENNVADLEFPKSFTDEQFYDKRVVPYVSYHTLREVNNKLLTDVEREIVISYSLRNQSFPEDALHNTRQ